jgi:integrase
LARAGTGELQPHVRPEEVAAALSAEPRQHVRAFIGFLWVTGARISEALSLRVSGLDMRRREVTLITLKRRKPMRRVLPLPASMVGELAIVITSGMVPSDGRPFPWSRSRAFEVVRDAFMRVGVERRRCHPHALRHGHSIHALRSGVRLNTLQRQLGHASIVTTSGYLKNTAEEARQEYEGVKW